MDTRASAGIGVSQGRRTRERATPVWALVLAPGDQLVPPARFLGGRGPLVAASFQAMAHDRYWITGVVRERETGRSLHGLVVRAFDRDVVFDDVLGFAMTDEDGHFRIAYTSEQFRDWFESNPDVYLRVFDRDGVREIFHTRARLRHDADREEHFELEIPAGNLEPRS